MPAAGPTGTSRSDPVLLAAGISRIRASKLPSVLEHRRNGLYALGTCAIGGGAGWLFTHPGGVWTYIAWALIVVGVLAILAAMYRQGTTTEPVDDGGQRAPAGQQASSTDPIAASTPVITDRWRLTTDGHQVPALMHLRNNSMSHPGYTEQSFLENPQPSVRIGVVMPSEPLGSTPATSDIRASFLKFLHGQPVTDFLAALTVVNADARWTANDGHGRFNFGAVLNGDTALAPVAWARLLLPQTDTSYHGYDPRSAVFILHVYPRARDGSTAPAANLTAWHGRLVLRTRHPQCAGRISHPRPRTGSRGWPISTGRGIPGSTALHDRARRHRGSRIPVRFIRARLVHGLGDLQPKWPGSVNPGTGMARSDV